MTFDAPMPWMEVLKAISGLTAKPTSAGSAELSTLPKDVRALSLFSARTTSAEYLSHVREVLQEYSAGKINMATATMKLQEWLAKLGYTPEGGFPGHEGEVPPAATQLQNLASAPRIKLVIETLARHAQSAAYLQGGMDADSRYNWPAWEFLRLHHSRIPRGSTGRENDIGWQERWIRSGGKLYEGRMIATKDDDVWDNISDSSIWDDGMDSDCDPVVFNTGYGRMELPRATCVKLGVIDEGDGVEARKISILGRMFDKDPAKVTLADVSAKRQKIIEALAMLKKAA
jgi:hypothetical protein